MVTLLRIGAVATFLSAEAVTFIAFRKIPGDAVFPGKWFALFMVALPIVAGLRGIASVRRRLPSASDDVILELSVRFLFTIIMAYAAIIVCVGSMSSALHLR